MSRRIQWLVGLSAVLIAVAVIAATILPFLFPQSGWGAWQGMMGPNHMFGGGPMLGGFGTLAFFGLGLWLMPLLFVGLVVFGVVWLVRSLAAPAAPQPAVAGVFCSTCGKPLQAGWKACPYCGEKVA